LAVFPGSIDGLQRDFNMKTTAYKLLMMGGLMVASAAPLTAQPANPPEPGDRPDRQAQRKQILERFDKNNDGELDEEEREAARESFQRGPNERGRSGGPPDASGREAGPPRGRGGRSRGGRGGSRSGQRIEVIPKFDKDKDGVLDKSERSAAIKYVKEQRKNEGDDNRGQRGGRPPRPDGARGGRPPARGDRGARPDPRGGSSRPAPEPRDFSKAERLEPGNEKDLGTKLYDEGTLRTLFIKFKDNEWMEEMEAFYRTDVAVPADLTVDGKLYKNVGLKFRGNSSFRSVSRDLKRSMNLYIDHKHSDQKLLGYKTLNLLNANSDPTFMREVIYSHVARNYIPAFKGNFIKVVINGESWGLYSHIQQYNKDFLEDNFGTRDGVRWKIGAGGGGSGNLRYPGEKKEDYNGFQQRTEGKEEAWKELQQFTKLLDESPIEELADKLNGRFNIDSAMWSLALECVFQDEGYFTRGSDYNLYLDPDGRFHLLQHDGNEVMNIPGGPGMPTGLSGPKLEPFYNADNPDRPLMYKLFQVPQFKARYRHHLKTITQEWITWDKIGPLVEGYAALIRDEVKKDVRKHSSYEAFEKGLIQTSSDGRRTKLGLRPFTEGRREYLLNHPEVNLPAPKIVSVTKLDEAKSTDSIRIDAETSGETLAKTIFLWFADGKNEPYKQMAMQHDGQANGGVFTANIPAQLAGKKIRYYVEARSDGAEMTSDFYPAHAEAKPLTFRVKAPKASQSVLTINEIVSENQAAGKDPQGDYDDYIEIANTSDSEVDLSGKFLTDSKKIPRKWRFPKGTKIAAGGRLVVWADEDGKAKEGLHANFKLAKAGETIQLIDTDNAGNSVLDEVNFSKLGPDSAYRRLPDAKGDFSEGAATPGAANE
tara:strand:+ start:2762 stop:5395 length:2634 start_codon:yes stop_codon:yes gene_type:complete